MSTPGTRLHDKTIAFIEGEARLLRDQMFVEPLEPHLSQTIAAHWNGEAVRGKVKAIGAGRYPNIHERGSKDGKPFHRVRESTQFRPTEVKIGDIVQLGGMEIGGYLWPKVIYNGVECCICSEQDVTFIER